MSGSTYLSLSLSTDVRRSNNSSVAPSSIELRDLNRTLGTKAPSSFIMTGSPNAQSPVPASPPAATAASPTKSKTASPKNRSPLRSKTASPVAQNSPAGQVAGEDADDIEVDEGLSVCSLFSHT